MTTEILKVHGFTNVDETEFEPDDAFMNAINTILPGRMFCVYDASDDNPGWYIVEYIEIDDYKEA